MQVNVNIVDTLNHRDLCPIRHVTCLADLEKQTNKTNSYGNEHKLTKIAIAILSNKSKASRHHTVQPQKYTPKV